MATNQEGRHAAFRAISGTTGTYNEDALAAMIAEGGTGDTFNGVMVSWLQTRLSSSQTNLTDLMNEFGVNEGFRNWNDMNTFSAAP
jgi:hypothetical protein